MGRAGDDRLVDPFDPGVETGNLRHAPRDHELEPELGAHPFDPGPGRYDDRRARKAAQREQRERRRRDERAARIDPQVEIPPPTPTGPVAAAAAQASPAPASEPAEPVPKRGSPEPPDRPATVTELRPRVSMAERLERERAERERVERERRTRVERERAERERGEREGREARRRARAEQLRREREALHRRQSSAARPRPAAQHDPLQRPRPVASRRPGVSGPVRPRRGLLWPTAKAGVAITLVLGLSAALGSVLGLPVPGPNAGAGHAELANSADLFGIDPGTPAGLSSGYVFPLIGPHDFGDALARFGAPRSGHTHEGQDIFGKTGTPEVAVHNGVVVDRGKVTDPDDGGRGNYVAIYSQQDNRSFVYMHMLEPASVQLGQDVHAGEMVGKLGCTGVCEGPHLHFEVRIGKASFGADTKPVDPLPYLRQWPQATP
jgi:murein DD-endopeptidase MepM/ murein hydrolase activator NlpD